VDLQGCWGGFVLIAGERIRLVERNARTGPSAEERREQAMNLEKMVGQDAEKGCAGACRQQER
jgi:hypothetical protein